MEILFKPFKMNFKPTKFQNFDPQHMGQVHHRFVGFMFILILKWEILPLTILIYDFSTDWMNDSIYKKFKRNYKSKEGFGFGI